MINQLMIYYGDKKIKIVKKSQVSLKKLSLLNKKSVEKGSVLHLEDNSSSHIFSESK